VTAAPRPPRATGGRQEVLARAGRRGLGELLGKPVAFATDTVGASATAPSQPRRRRDRAAGERPVQPGRDRQGRRREGRFADRLAAFADLFVSDGFGAVHRRHASVYDIAEDLPSAPAT